MLTQESHNVLLISALEAHGVRHLRAPASPDTHLPPDTIPPDTPELIVSLASHPDVRFREALIPFFLYHPDCAGFVPDLEKSLESRAAVELRHFYTAAVYLQRLWRGALGIYLGEFPLLPDYFGENEFGLPSPDVYFGEAGLRALAELFKKKTGYEWWSAYQSVIALFLKQLSLEQHAPQTH